MSTTQLPPAILQYDFKYQSAADPIVNLPNSAYNITPDPWQIVTDDPKFGQCFQCSNAGVANLKVPAGWDSNLPTTDFTFTAWVKISSGEGDKTIFSLDSTGGTVMLCVVGNSLIMNFGPPGSSPGIGANMGGPPNQSGYQLINFPFNQSQVQDQWVYLAVSFSTNNPVQIFLNAAGSWSTQKAAHPNGFDSSSTLFIGQPNATSNRAGLGDIAWFAVYNQAVSDSSQLETDMNTRQKFTLGTVSSDLPAAVLQYDFKFQSVQDPIINLPNPAYNMTPDPWKIVQNDPKFGQDFQCSNPGSANLEIPTAWNANSLYPECTITTWVKLSDLGNQSTIFSLGFTPIPPNGQHIPAQSFLLYNTSNSLVLSEGPQGRNPGTGKFHRQLLSLSFDPSQVKGEWVYLALSINSSSNQVTLFVNAGGNWSSAKPAHPYGLPTSADFGPIYIGQSSPANVGVGMGEIAWFSVYPKAVSGSIDLVADMMSRKKITPTNVTKLLAPLLQYDFKCETPFGPIVNLTNPKYDIPAAPWKIFPEDPKFGQVFQCSNTGVANLPVPHSFSVNSFYPECTITTWVKINVDNGSQTIFSFADNGQSFVLYNTTTDWVLSKGSPGRNPGTGGIPIVQLSFAKSQVQNQWVYLAVSFTKAGEVNLYMNAGGSWNTKSSGSPPPHFPYGLKSTGMGPLLIGQSNAGYSGKGMGYIAWLSVYPESVSDSTQLETDMNTRQKYSPAPPTFPDKLIDFDFNNISGSTLTNPPYTALNSSLGSGVNSGTDSTNVFGNVLHFNGGTNPGVTIPPLKAYYKYPLFSLHTGMSLTAWIYLDTAQSETGSILSIKGMTKKVPNGGEEVTIFNLGVDNTDWYIGGVKFPHSGIQNEWVFVAFVIENPPTGAGTVTQYQYTEKAGWISPQTATGSIQLDEYCGIHNSHLGSFSPLTASPAIPGFTGQLAKFSLHLNQLTETEVKAEMPHQHSAIDLSVVYDFEGITGTTLPSTVNSRYNGTISAGIKPPATDAEHGKCLAFGGSDEVTIPGLGDYGITNFQNAFSLTAWVNLSDISSTARTILTLGSTQTGDNLAFGYTSAGWQLSYGGKTVDFAFNQNEIKGKWVFVALTKGQQAGITCTHYISGNKITNTGNGPVSLPDGVGMVNNSIGSTANGLVGKVAWFALYDQEISQEQILSDMVAKGTVILPEPVLEFNFKSISNSVIPNLCNSTYKATYGAGCSLFNDPEFGKTLSFSSSATATVSPALSGVGTNDLSKGLTIGCWVNLANASGTSKLFSIGTVVNLDYDSASSFTLSSDSSAPLTGSQSTSSVGNWTYVAATLDSSGNATISIFDGETWTQQSGKLSNINLAGINSQSIYLGATSGSTNGFAGDIAWLSVYHGALTEKFFEEDMMLGKLQSNTSFRNNVPINFKLTSFENGENVPILFIEQKGQGKVVNLTLTNANSQKITIPTGTASVSASYAQFQIRFKPGVLSTGFLGKSKALAKTNTNHEDYWTDGRWQIAVYTDPLTNEGLLNIVNSGSSIKWTPKQVLTVKTGPINADPLGGVRGTTTMLHYMGLNMGKNPVSGFRIQSLGIVSHLGQKNIPMHVGILGADRVLNNGTSDDLIIRIENTDATTSIPLTSTIEDTKAKFVVGFEIQSENSVMDWALMSYQDNPATKLHWNMLGVLKGTAALGDTIIELDQPLTQNLTTASPDLIISASTGTPTPVTLTFDAAIGHRHITVKALTKSVSAGAVVSLASGQSDWSIANQGSIPSKTSGSFSWKVDYSGTGELAPGESIDFLIKDIICDLPAGQSVISFQYSNLGGYWDGEFTIIVEKSAISMNQSTVGIGITPDNLVSKAMFQIPYTNDKHSIGLLVGNNNGMYGTYDSAITVVNSEDTTNAFAIVKNSQNANSKGADTVFLIGEGGNIGFGTTPMANKTIAMPYPNHDGYASGIIIDDGTALDPTDNIAIGVSCKGQTGGSALSILDNNGDNALNVDYEGTTTVSDLNVGSLGITGSGTSDLGTISATELTITGSDVSSLRSVNVSALSCDYPSKGAYGILIGDEWPQDELAAALCVTVPDSHSGYAPAFTVANKTNTSSLFSVACNGQVGMSTLIGGTYKHIFSIGYDNYVGIRTRGPVAPLDVEHEASGTNQSINATGYVGATKFTVQSDARVKNVLNKANNKEDLETVNRLVVQDYKMTDTKLHGDNIQKGLIAQEVSSIIPHAVNKSPGYVPDIYADATQVITNEENKTLEVHLAKPHGLQVGDMVRILGEGDYERYEVTKVASDQSFVVKDWELNTPDVFVYGKKIDDLHGVDYNAVSMIGISATQQLSKEVEALKAENANLKQQLTEGLAELRKEIKGLKKG